MIDCKMGQVVPFRLSAGKMRKSAYEHRRRGRPMEAVELLRRAAQQEDTPAGWLHLAEELRRLGCYEQAEVLLYRMAARDEIPQQVWMELARCQAALGKQEAATDSLYHYLAEDPYSDIADEARSMLADLEQEEDVREPFRLMAMARRGLTAWREGNRALGERRLKRAARLSIRPTKLYVTLALLYLAENEFDKGVAALCKALRFDPQNAQAACALSVALHAQGRRRLALGMLHQAEPLCYTPQGEDMFLTSAWTLSANGARERFLLARHRQQPCRIVLMHHLADLCWSKHEGEQARAWWHRILRLDPGDIRARAMLRNTQEGGEIPPAGMLPQTEVKLMLQAMMQADADRLSPEEMIRPGTDSRAAVDWCFTVSSEGVQQKGLDLLATQDSPAVRLYLRELLLSPTVYPQIRHRIMLHMAQLGETGPLNVLMGQRVTSAECTSVPQGNSGLWRAFLPRLLEETRRHRQSEALVEFAAELWPQLTRKQQHQAAGMDGYLWVKAMEILYLRFTEQDAAAAKCVRKAPVSMRKVSRVLRQIARRLDGEAIMEG